MSSTRMTLGEMRSHVFMLIDEEPNVLFKYADVDRLLNRGIVLVAEKVGRRETTTIIPTIEGASAYELEDPYLDRDFQAQVSSVTLEGIALDYTIEDDSIILSEPTETGELPLRVRYKREMKPLVEAEDYSPVSYEASDVACIFAVYSLKLRDDETATADRWRREYEERYEALGRPLTGLYKAANA